MKSVAKNRVSNAVSDPVAAISDAVLYEGYLLYPYRESALKNQFRWTFGTLFPQQWCDDCDPSERWSMAGQCLLRFESAARVDLRVRFLCLDDQEEVAECELGVADVAVAPLLDGQEKTWTYGEPRTPDAARQDGSFATANLPKSANLYHVDLQLSGEPVLESPGAARISLTVTNRAPLPANRALTRQEATSWSLLSTHLQLTIRGGEFVSLTDPPADLAAAAGHCRQDGCWPVLVGSPGRTDQLLVAPIILSDYPQVAAQSYGDSFDGTEIDEMLALRIRTLTDAEKEQVRRTDPRGAAMLERTESLDDESLARLHAEGQLGEPTTTGDAASLEPPITDRAQIRPPVAPGDRVRLHPRAGGDIFDLALAGRIGVVESIERDFEDNIYVVVTAECDPGRDLGQQGLPGHRFFFRTDEVELVASESSSVDDRFQSGADR